MTLDDDTFEPHHESSPTEHALNELELHGYRHACPRLDQPSRTPSRPSNPLSSPPVRLKQWCLHGARIAQSSQGLREGVWRHGPGSTSSTGAGKVCELC